MSLQVLTLSGLDYKDRRTSLQPKQHRNIQLTGHYIPCRLLTTATWSFVRCCCSLGIEPRERHSSAYRARRRFQVQVWTWGTEHGTRSSRLRSAIRNAELRAVCRSTQTALTRSSPGRSGSRTDVLPRKTAALRTVVRGSRRPGLRDNAVCGELRKKPNTKPGVDGAGRFCLSHHSRVPPTPRGLRHRVCLTLALDLLSLHELTHVVPAEQIPIPRHL